MTLFEKGRAKTGGRRKGARDRIGTAFLEELAKDFEEHGVDAIKICRVERPTDYLKIIASTLPREFELSTETSLSELTDQDLDRFIDFARRRLEERAREVTESPLRIGSRETEAAN